MAKAVNLVADVVVVGAGPNGLAAAIEMVRAGHATALLEMAPTVGGACRSAELTLRGFVHDVCSAVFPLGSASPFLSTLPLAGHGLEWIHPPVPLAHPLDDGTAVVLDRSLERTAADLGPDRDAWLELMEPLAASARRILPDILAPLRFPDHPILLAKFGRWAIRSARGLADRFFQGTRARALMAGLCAHSFLPMEQAPSAAFGLLLGMLGHAAGWPIVRGGSQRLADAMAGCFRSLGGQVLTGVPVRSLSDLPAVRAVLMDVSPPSLSRIGGWWLPRLYRRQLATYRYGPGVFKIDWALDGPIPWRADACRRAGTVHLGGTFDQVADGERAVARGEHPEEPFVLLAQQSLFDPSRAPTGRHTGWAYCHVPNGSREDMTERIERQVERFAPGFHKIILARHTRTAAQLERYNPNCVGGDINGGLADIRQLFIRPAVRRNLYGTPIEGLYLCSAATPPGGGVHGMCGYHAAQEAIRQMRRAPRQEAAVRV